MYEYYCRYPPLYECGRTINQTDTWVRAGRGASQGNGQPRRTARPALCLQILSPDDLAAPRSAAVSRDHARDIKLEEDVTTSSHNTVTGRHRGP